MESQYEYGSRCGVYRILKIFEKYDYKFTCYAVGKAVELNASPVKEMIKQGHEIASHSTCLSKLDLIFQRLQVD